MAAGKSFFPFPLLTCPVEPGIFFEYNRTGIDKGTAEAKSRVPGRAPEPRWPKKTENKGDVLMKRRILAGVMMLAFFAAVAGCASYYRVTDPTSNKTYYTKDMDRDKSGSIVFKDAVTGNEVTLQTSEIKEIDKSVFKDNTPNL
jgi:hypothetical protein